MKNRPTGFDIVLFVLEREGKIKRIANKHATESV
jgi:hypothetical protein